MYSSKGSQSSKKLDTYAVSLKRRCWSGAIASLDFEKSLRDEIPKKGENSPTFFHAQISV